MQGVRGHGPYSSTPPSTGTNRNLEIWNSRASSARFIVLTSSTLTTSPVRAAVAMGPLPLASMAIAMAFDSEQKVLSSPRTCQTRQWKVREGDGREREGHGR